MLYLDDRLPGHPKILKAGQRLGPDGAAKALYLYVWGLAYSRQHLTDGFISSTVLASCGAISGSGSIAKVLANRTIRLWRKVKGGYQIHDFHVYNPKASEEKEKRELNRQRMAQWRAAKAKARNAICNSATSPFVRELSTSTSTSTSTKSTSTGTARRLAFARPKIQTPETPTFALACVVMREAMACAAIVDHDLTIATVGEHFKLLCARRGLAYDADLVRRAYDAVTATQRRRA
jgi:hypothetical protein